MNDSSMVIKKAEKKTKIRINKKNIIRDKIVGLKKGS